MVHTSHFKTGSDEPTASEQTSNEANISHHSAQTRPTRELHPASTSSSLSARLFTPTTHNTAFARLRFRRGPHFFPQHSGSAQLHLPTTGLLLLPLAMAHPGQPYIKKTNKRGDVFFDYGGTPDQLTAELCFPYDNSDDNEHGGELTVTWWPGISFPPDMRSPCPSISIAGSSRYFQGHVAMRKQSATKRSDTYRSSCNACCHVRAQSWFCDVSVTISCVPSEQSFSNRYLLRLSHILEPFRIIRK